MINFLEVAKNRINVDIGDVRFKESDNKVLSKDSKIPEKFAAIDHP